MSEGYVICHGQRGGGQPAATGRVHNLMQSRLAGPTSTHAVIHSHCRKGFELRDEAAASSRQSCRSRRASRILDRIPDSLALPRRLLGPLTTPTGQRPPWDSGLGDRPGAAQQPAVNLGVANRTDKALSKLAFYVKGQL
jgi:hypothetical protein